MRRPKFSSCFLLRRGKKSLEGGLFVGSGGCLQLVAAWPRFRSCRVLLWSDLGKCEKPTLKPSDYVKNGAVLGAGSVK